MSKQIIIQPEDAGKRLDVYLAAQLPQASRSRLQKLIKTGDVTLNGKKTTPHEAVAAGAVVEFPEAAGVAPANELVPRADLALDIVHEDAAVLVINKPAGQLVHPAAGETDTVANAVLGRYPAVAKVGESPDRPGIVHRLDKDASGLLVIAKTPKAYASLKQQFQDHTVLKEYAVLVGGTPPEDAGTINLAVGRASFGGKMAAHAEAREGDREATTHYTVEERYPNAALLAVRTETGRTHQIRVHLNALGCPVAGDVLYGLKNAARLAAPRLFLHCRRLGFDHPKTGQRVEFTAPLPQELKDYLEKMKK